MPTVLRVGPYRFFFYSADGSEPRHVHVEAGDGYAKIWLEPVRLAESNGFRAAEIRRIETLVGQQADASMRKWDEFFGV